MMSLAGIFSRLETKTSTFSCMRKAEIKRLAIPATGMTLPPRQSGLVAHVFTAHSQNDSCLSYSYYPNVPNLVTLMLTQHDAVRQLDPTSKTRATRKWSGSLVGQKHATHASSEKLP
jgi:hypothetical protein